jgi:hypothetical protein
MKKLNNMSDSTSILYDRKRHSNIRGKYQKFNQNIKGKEIENASTSTSFRPKTKKRMKCFHHKRLGHAIKICKTRITIEKIAKMQLNIVIKDKKW